jgi:hypothetical protein
MNPDAVTQSLVRQIVAHVRCAHCRHHFGLSDIHVLGKRDQMWAMSVRCRECRTQSLIFASLGDKGIRSAYSDLAPSDWDRFKTSPPISDEDVISVHRYLQEYDGDFSELLDEPLPPE